MALNHLSQTSHSHINTSFKSHEHTPAFISASKPSPSPTPIPSSYRNNASAIAPLSINVKSIDKFSSSESDEYANHIDVHANDMLLTLRKEVFLVIQEITPEFLERWTSETCTPEDLIIERLTGGLTNHLLMVTIRPKNNDMDIDPDANAKANADAGENTKKHTLLLRIHGHGQDENEETNVIHRNIENKISAELSKNGIAPIFHGRFANGRIEQFYQGMRTLSCKEMSQVKYTRAIAIQMARLHNTHMPWLMEAYREEIESDGKGLGLLGLQGQIWGRIEMWVRQVQEIIRKDGNSSEEDDYRRQNVRNMANEMEKEWEWVKEEWKYIFSTNYGEKEGRHKLAMDFCKSLTFAHMDCQCLNILTKVNDRNVDNNRNEDGNDDGVVADVRLIDFEFAGINPRAVDIGNTFAEFCEMTNLAPDYKIQYPSASVQNIFVMAYIRENNHNLAKAVEEMCDEERDLFLVTMREVIQKFSLLSHLGWAFWALAQSSASTIDYDYVTYAKLRIDGYHFFKERQWSNL